MKTSKLFNKLWNSPTLMTWMSYFTKSANLLLVLPLILKQFSTGDVAVWFLFATMLSMSGLVDLGFSTTFSRLIALAFGGANDVKVFNRDTGKSDGLANWNLIERLYSTMRRMYIYLAIGVLVLLLTAGSLSLMNPISQSGDPVQTWIAWLVIIIGIVGAFYGNIFSNYLLGLYQVALVKRIETIFKLGSIFSSFAILLIAPNILNLSIVNSTWMLINALRDRYLCRMVFDKRLQGFKNYTIDKVLLKKVWPSAWRSGLSSLMSNGLTNLTGILYAQVGNTPLIAGYVIALRVITEIRNVSNAPFYSKVPLIARLRAEGDYKRLIKVSQRGMLIAHITFTCSVILVGLFFNKFISLTGTHVKFVEPNLWLLMSFAFYIHRYGAMHMQLYLTTNHVIAHIADGVSGIIFIVSAYFLTKYIGLYGVPIGMLCGYLGFYAWYAASYSIRSVGAHFFRYEFKASLIPACLFVLYTIYNMVFFTGPFFKK